jgi:hypothetical protein
MSGSAHRRLLLAAAMLAVAVLSGCASYVGGYGTACYPGYSYYYPGPFYPTYSGPYPFGTFGSHRGFHHRSLGFHHGLRSGFHRGSQRRFGR